MEVKTFSGSEFEMFFISNVIGFLENTESQEKFRLFNSPVWRY